MKEYAFVEFNESDVTRVVKVIGESKREALSKYAKHFKVKQSELEDVEGPFELKDLEKIKVEE